MYQNLKKCFFCKEPMNVSILALPIGSSGRLPPPLLEKLTNPGFPDHLWYFIKEIELIKAFASRASGTPSASLWGENFKRNFQHRLELPFFFLTEGVNERLVHERCFYDMVNSQAVRFQEDPLRGHTVSMEGVSYDCYFIYLAQLPRQAEYQRTLTEQHLPPAIISQMTRMSIEASMTLNNGVPVYVGRANPFGKNHCLIDAILQLLDFSRLFPLSQRKEECERIKYALISKGQCPSLESTLELSSDCVEIILDTHFELYKYALDSNPHKALNFSHFTFTAYPFRDGKFNKHHLSFVGEGIIKGYLVHHATHFDYFKNIQSGATLVLGSNCDLRACTNQGPSGYDCPSGLGATPQASTRNSFVGAHAVSLGADPTVGAAAFSDLNWGQRATGALPKAAAQVRRRRTSHTGGHSAPHSPGLYASPYAQPFNSSSGFPPFRENSQSGYEAPQSGYEAPQSGYEAPRSGYEVPQSRYEVPQLCSTSQLAPNQYATPRAVSLTDYRQYAWHTDLLELSTSTKENTPLLQRHSSPPPLPPFQYNHELGQYKFNPDTHLLRSDDSIGELLGSYLSLIDRATAASSTEHVYVAVNEDAEEANFKKQTLFTLGNLSYFCYLSQPIEAQKYMIVTPALDISLVNSTVNMQAYFANMSRDIWNQSGFTIGRRRKTVGEEFNKFKELSDPQDKKLVIVPLFLSKEGTPTTRREKYFGFLVACRFRRTFRIFYRFGNEDASSSFNNHGEEKNNVLQQIAIAVFILGWKDYSLLGIQPKLIRLSHEANNFIHKNTDDSENQRTLLMQAVTLKEIMQVIMMPGVYVLSPPDGSIEANPLLFPKQSLGTPVHSATIRHSKIGAALFHQLQKMEERASSQHYGLLTPFVNVSDFETRKYLLEELADGIKKLSEIREYSFYKDNKKFLILILLLIILAIIVCSTLLSTASDDHPAFSTTDCNTTTQAATTTSTSSTLPTTSTTTTPTTTTPTTTTPTTTTSTTTTTVKPVPTTPLTTTTTVTEVTFAPTLAPPL